MSINSMIYTIQSGCHSVQSFFEGCAYGSAILSIASAALGGVAAAFSGMGYAEGAWYGLLTGGQYTTLNAVSVAPVCATAALFLFKLALISAALFIIFKIVEKVAGFFADL